MYSDLFDQLGRGGRGAGAGGTAEEPAPLLSFKAGRMTLEKSGQGSAPFHCTPDTTRGEVRLVKTSAAAASGMNAITSGGGGGVSWQWYDRRSASVKDTFTELGGTFTKVPSPNPVDRIYVWTKDDNTTHRMYWMQDKDDSKDEEIVKSVNDYLQGKNAGATGSGGAAAAAGGDGESPAVDALSSILENLGMPQEQQAAAGTAASASDGGGAAAAASTSSGTGGTTANQLTLADLQGAMAGIQNAPGAPISLTDIVTTDAINAVMQDEAACARLVALLPDDQQSPERLRENLTSPQVQSTLRALQAALQPDDTGDMSGYASVIANFQLDANAGQASLAAGNPVQAFLDCILASVAKEEEEAAATADAGSGGGGETKEDTKDEEMKE